MIELWERCDICHGTGHVKDYAGCPSCACDERHGCGHRPVVVVGTLPPLPFYEAAERMARAEYRRAYGCDWIEGTHERLGYIREAGWRLRAAIGEEER